MVYITNYIGEVAYTNTDQQTKGIPLTNYKQDKLGKITGIADQYTGEFTGDGRYLEVPSRTANKKVTIDVKPKNLVDCDLVSTATGTISTHTDGTVTASSGTVTIDTTTLQTGVQSKITVDGISIDGVSKLFEGFNGTILTYKEEQL